MGAWEEKLEVAVALQAVAEPTAAVTAVAGSIPIDPMLDSSSCLAVIFLHRLVLEPQKP